MSQNTTDIKVVNNVIKVIKIITLLSVISLTLYNCSREEKEEKSHYKSKNYNNNEKLERQIDYIQKNSKLNKEEINNILRQNGF